VTQIYLSLGSNENREHNIRAAVAELKALLGKLQCSSVYQSPSIDGGGADYFNLVVAADTSLNPALVQQKLKTIEKKLHRNHATPEKVTIDIDLLLYGSKTSSDSALMLPHHDIRAHEHVLIPLSELIPQLSIPGETCTLDELKTRKTMAGNVRRIDFDPVN